MPCPRDACPHILVVEDNDDARELFVMFFEREGYEVTSVDSAEDGLDAMRSGCFDVVITDYHLPAHTGTWMVAAARDAGLLRDERVLVVTAACQVDGAEGLRVLPKPVDLGDLLGEVEKARAH